MKALVVLFCDFFSDSKSGGGSPYAVSDLFDGASAFERALSAAAGFPCAERILCCAPNPEIFDTLFPAEGRANSVSAEIVKASFPWRADKFLSAVEENADGFDAVYIAPGDAPFLDAAAARRLWDRHTKYAAEYSFADGYPLGLFPEIAAAGIIPILRRLIDAETSPPASRDMFFSLVKKDINSFDIETEIAPMDMRSLRLELLCNNKRNSLLCERLFAIDRGSSLDGDFLQDAEVRGSGAGAVQKNAGLQAETFPIVIKKRPDVFRTLPSYYYIQATRRCPHRCSICPYAAEKERFAAFNGAPIVLDGEANAETDMPFDKLRALIKDAYTLSGDAVISLSLWGEPAFYPRIEDAVQEILSYPSLSAFIETTGVGWRDGSLERIAKIVKDAPPRFDGRAPIQWVVSLDAVSSEYYRLIHGADSFAEAIARAEELFALFPDQVWPQMVRVNENEAHLEAFYRYWKEKKGRVLIQKYDYFCADMPPRKPADLAPIARNPCWRLKRDMAILMNGDVPICREDLRAERFIGNVFTDSLEKIWNDAAPLYERQCRGEYDGLCGKCDEYYTFNF